MFGSPTKEPAFFIFEGSNFNPKQTDYDIYKILDWSNCSLVTDLHTYEALFEDVSSEIAIGEASTGYLNHHRAPDRILHHLPEAKLIAVLRDPAERAYSAYLMDVLNGLDDLTLSEIITTYQELEQKESGIRLERPILFYISAGFYYQGLGRYFQQFDQRKIGIFWFDDFRKDPEEFVCNVFLFLGVDVTFRPDFEQRFNVGQYPKNRRLHTAAVSLNQVTSALRGVLPTPLRHRLSQAYIQSNLGLPPPMSSELRASLIDIYRQDISQLQKFT